MLIDTRANKGFDLVSQVYGGYVTSLLVSGEESTVKCGAVLSPITDFELYGEPCLFT